MMYRILQRARQNDDPLWSEFLEGQNYQCGICGKDLMPHGVVIDHIVPRSQGGGDGLFNLQAAHWDCNARKGNRLGYCERHLHDA